MAKQIRITGLILFILTILWVVLMGISTASIEPDWRSVNYVEWATNHTKAHTLNYLNVSILTIGVVFLFAQLYMFLKDKFRGAAISGLLFVPIYGVINLVCYSIQISVVPAMAENALNSNEYIELVAQLIQANPSSLVGFLNALAYGILGIPSMIYGYLLIKNSKKFTGYFLLFNGVFCLLGVAGVLMESKILSMGVMIGGLLFLISLGALLVEFRSFQVHSDAYS